MFYVEMKPLLTQELFFKRWIAIYNEVEEETYNLRCNALLTWFD